jgi:hypothetical protein
MAHSGFCGSKIDPVQIRLKLKSTRKKLHFLYQSAYYPECPLSSSPTYSFAETLNDWIRSEKREKDVLDNTTFLIYLTRSVVETKSLNEYLKENGFQYTLTDTKLIVNCTDDVSFEHASLTPGEQIHLINLLINYEISNCLVTKNKYKDVVYLLDEPDAHLHPSLIPILIDTITKLVTFYGMQVIMTTHKPTTITLIKENECLFHMKIDPETKCLSMEPVSNRNHCIQLLTSNIIAVNGNLRLIFVEAEDDKRFYEIINERLMKQNYFLTDVQQLIFVCFGNNDKCSCRSAVINLVQKLTNDGDNNLKDFVYGLIDNDNDGEQKNTAHQNVITFERYAIENYIFDPINIFFYCFNDRTVRKPPEILKCWEQLRISYNPHLPAEPNRIGEILEHQVLNCSQKQVIFQTIVDCVSTLFLDKLQEIINEVNINKINKKPSKKKYEDIYDNFLNFNNVKARKLADIVNNQITLTDDKVDVIVPISNKKTITLQYNVILLLMGKYVLVNVYHEINTKFIMKHLLKCDKSFVKTQDIIIPQDLLLGFTCLHSSAPENHPAHKDLQKLVCKNTNNFTTANLDQSITVSKQQPASITRITTTTDANNLFDTDMNSTTEVRFIHYFNFFVHERSKPKQRPEAVASFLFILGPYLKRLFWSY